VLRAELEWVILGSHPEVLALVTALRAIMSDPGACEAMPVAIWELGDDALVSWAWS
jgi:hypothetical protein